MKAPHKHSEVIKAWADGKEIEVRPDHGWTWKPVEVFFPHLKSPAWYEYYEYRVKPEPEPDFVVWPHSAQYCDDDNDVRTVLVKNRLKLTFDGTGKLKAAEVL
jgi:hypothetical protein